MALNSTANNILITSENQNGIRTSGNSAVLVDPQFNCTITGDKDAVRISGNSTVDTKTCTLVSGGN